jgi:hypothetical protein
MKRIPVLIPFLIVVSILFIGILIFAYVETKKANPQMIASPQSAKADCGLEQANGLLHA